MFVVHTFQGDPTRVVPGKWAIVVSRYNESITSKLLDGALSTLREHGIPESDVVVAYTPGAFELPTIAGHLAESGRYLAVLCLGAVIRGETTHDRHINQAVSNAICEIGVRTGIPTLFGVLTCKTLEQAIHRSGGNVGNKGRECAQAALELVDLLQSLDRWGSELVQRDN